VKLDQARPAQLARTDYVDVQISLDGATAEVSRPCARRRLVRHRHPRTGELGRGRDEGLQGLRRRHAGPRENVGQLDEFKALTDSFGAQLQITRLRPSGRGADFWDSLHPTQAQQCDLYDWLLANGDNVLTGDSFFHLSVFGEALPGLNLCGAGRVVCLIDPVGEVYACPSPFTRTS